MAKLLIDYDYLLYGAGFVGEKRTIRVVHHESGDTHDFDNRSSFYGHWKKKAGGWLAEYNKGRETPRLAEEYDIFDVQTPEPLENSIHTLKQMIEGLKEQTGCGSNYYGYSSKGASFREGLSTVIKYKGNRENALRPVHLDSLKEYIVKRHNCVMVTEKEADDACTIDLYNGYKKYIETQSDKDKIILAFVDKDYWACQGFLLHANGDGSVFENKEWLGKLYLNDKGDVKGYGRMWLYHQILSGDDSDNYFANSASDMKWGDKSSYNLLNGCITDKQAIQAVVDGYKTLYPAKKTIEGWRGDTLEIDWLYMLQENWNMAHMLRWDGDKVVVKDVLDKLKITY